MKERGGVGVFKHSPSTYAARYGETQPDMAISLYGNSYSTALTKLSVRREFLEM